jgi:tetratricopeptide (TPR) repeat protein
MDRYPEPALVFISYSSADHSIAEAACNVLESNGVACWIAPRNVDPGLPYAGQIIQGLRESKAAVLLFSQDANQSANVLREIEFAINEGIPVLSIRLDQTVMNDDLAYFLRVVHWHDVSGRTNDQERVADLPGQVLRLFATAGSGEGKTPPAVASAARFGDFEILAAPDGRPVELGRGGMGVTYRARQLSMGGREVALKVINPQLMGDEGIRKRFLREAQTAGAIEHPNVALVYSRGQEGDSYFYAMQLVDGVDLDKYVKEQGPLSVGQALSVTAQVAAALEAARTKGLIHRDIKPSNIMAAEDRRNRLQIKLIDFGLAKNVGGATTPQSMVSGEQFIGTFAFASPEQCRRQELDTRSDLYSLGVTLWFLLTGNAPFRGSPEEVSGSHLFQDPPFEALPSVPLEVIELLKSLLAKDPANRPQTPAELEDRVEELLRSIPADLLAPSADAAQTGESTPVPKAGDDTGLRTLIGSPILSTYLAPAPGQNKEERFQLMQELREGVSGRLFRAREARGDTSREVGLKFLHPSIVSDTEKQKLLREQFDRVSNLPIDHLVAHHSLELSAQPPFLVREWLNGFSLSALLRWKQVLAAKELIKLLAPLPALLDQLAKHSLALAEVSLAKTFLAFPPDIASETFPVLAKRSIEGLQYGQLKLNPLSLRSLAGRSRNSDSDPTMLSTSRLLALSQAKMGIRGQAPVPLLGRLIYELLSGYPYPPQGTDNYTPLTAINEAGNRLLRAAIITPAAAGGFSDCQSFWQAFGPSLDLARRVTPTPLAVPPSRPGEFPPRITPPLRITPPPVTPPPTYETSAPDWSTQTGATQSTPFPKAAAQPARKRSAWMFVLIFFTVAALGFCVLAILTFSVTQMMIAGRHSETPATTPASTVTPAPSVATTEASPQPTLVVAATPQSSPTIVAPKETPLVSPSVTAPFNEAFTRAKREADQEQYDKAIADYTEAIRLKPDFADAYANRAFAYGSLEQFDKAIADCNEAIRLQPDSAEAYKNRGGAYCNLRQYDKAIADCNEAIRLQPDFARAYSNRGNAYVGLQQYDNAMADYNEAIRLDPNLAQAYSNRANTFNLLKQYDNAIADCTEAIRLKPNFALPYLNRSVAYNSLNQYDKAIPDCTEAIRLKPNLALAYTNRGIAYNNLKQYDKAIADFTEVIRLQPDLADAYSGRGFAYNGLALYDKGIADCSEAIRLNPDFVAPYLNRSVAYGSLKLYDKVIADCTEAIRIDPNNAVPYYDRGIAYYWLKHYEKAVEDYTEAIRLQPNYWQAYGNRASAYQQLGETNKARRDLARAKELK